MCDRLQMHVQVEEDDRPLSHIFRMPTPTGTKAKTVNSNLTLLSYVLLCMQTICVQQADYILSYHNWRAVDGRYTRVRGPAKTPVPQVHRWQRGMCQWGPSTGRAVSMTFPGVRDQRRRVLWPCWKTGLLAWKPQWQLRWGNSRPLCRNCPQ